MFPATTYEACRRWSWDYVNVKLAFAFEPGSKITDPQIAFRFRILKIEIRICKYHLEYMEYLKFLKTLNYKKDLEYS